MKPLIYGAAGPLQGFNPLFPKVEWNEVSSLVLSRLFREGPDGRLEPDLVESHSVAPGGRTWTLRLHDGIRWHDGEPCTSGDVRFTLERVLDPARPGKYAPDIAAIAGVETPDPLTVVLHLREPAPLLSAPLREIPILPRHRMEGEDVSGPAFDADPVGTGPYRVVARGSGEVRFRRHEGHFRGAPAISELVLRSIPSEEGRLAALQSGEVHAAHLKAPTLAGCDTPGFVAHRMETTSFLAMVLNARIPFLSDARVRRALAMATDRAAIIREGYAGCAQPLTACLSPRSWAYPASRPVPARDPDGARRLLREAGCTWDAAGRLLWRGGPVSLLWNVWKDEPARRRGAELLKRWWGELGIELVPDLVDFRSYDIRAQSLGGTHAGFLGGWGGMHDPADVLARKFHSRGSQNYGAFSDPEVDRLLDELRPLGECEEARRRLEVLFDRLDEQVPWMPVAGRGWWYVGASPALRGIAPGIPCAWYEYTMYAHGWAWA